MNKLSFFITVLLGITVQLNAQLKQDSLAVDTVTTLLLPPPSALYNYTSPYLSNPFNDQLRTGASNRFVVDFDYYANSNSVPTSIVYAMLFKNEVKDVWKDRAAKRMKAGLKFEDFMNTGLTYKHYFKKWDGTVMVDYHHRQMRIIRGSRDAFELLFYGNARFEDKTADLSNITFINHIYNQIGVAVEKKVVYSHYQMEYGVRATFLQAINDQEIRTGKTTIYTAPDGEYIDLNYDLTFNTGREGATNFLQVNGAGASGDFHLAVMNHDKWRISADLFDVGYMQFRKTPVNYTGAKSIHFQGIVLPDLLNFSAQTFDTLKIADTLRGYLPSKSTNQYGVFMPFSAQVVFSKPILSNKVVINFGLMYRYLPQYYVYGFAKVNYFIKPDMVFSASAGAGGYSLFNLGAEFSKAWKYFDFTVGSANLIGLMAPTHFPGASVYLRLGTSF
ncbi:MAG: DUF5723 family protein [Chitinophagales bacterium]